jgi:hypothetical protein
MSRGQITLQGQSVKGASRRRAAPGSQAVGCSTDALSCGTSRTGHAGLHTFLLRLSARSWRLTVPHAKRVFSHSFVLVDARTQVSRVPRLPSPVHPEKASQGPGARPGANTAMPFTAAANAGAGTHVSRKVVALGSGSKRMVTCPVRSNPSLKRSANGRPPGPGCRYAVHFLHPGPGVLPSSPA